MKLDIPSRLYTALLVTWFAAVAGSVFVFLPAVLPQGATPERQGGDAELIRLHEHQQHVVGRMAERIIELEE